jgi:hypothetical protein
MSFLSKLTRSLYSAARISNEARIAERVIEGHPETLIKHLRNKLYYRAFGRFLK